MLNEEDIDELVDRTINGVMSRDKIENEDVKKRKPKPFRYLTNKKEIKAELEKDQSNLISVMKEQAAIKIVDEKFAILGLGDMKTIESVIRKHEISKKFR